MRNGMDITALVGQMSNSRPVAKQVKNRFVTKRAEQKEDSAVFGF